MTHILNNTCIIMPIGVSMAIIGQVMTEFESPSDNKRLRKTWNVSRTLLKYTGIGLTLSWSLSVLNKLNK